jgi:hypothetical protein
MKKLKVLSVLMACLLALSLIFVSCELGGGKSGKLAFLNIKDAKNLYIAPAKNKRSAARAQSNDVTVNRLFKITDEGVVQEVSYENENGETISISLYPTNIIIMGDEYLIVTFNKDEHYLVNSSTGACYEYTKDLPNHNPNKTEYFDWGSSQGEFPFFNDYSSFSTKHILNDSYGNIYFLVPAIFFGPGLHDPTKHSVSIRKITVTDINNVTISTVSAQNDYVTSFGVDQYGNIAYSGYEDDRQMNSLARYRGYNGGFELLPYGGGCFWTGFNGKLYYSGNGISEITPTPYTVTQYSNLYVNGNTLLKMKSKGRILLLGDTSGVEVYNHTTQTASQINYSTLFGMQSIKSNIAAASDNYYYLFGISGTQYVLIRVNPDDNSYTTLLNGGYDIYKMTVRGNDTVVFNALRLSDGAIILGEISKTGTLTVLDETLHEEITVLVRVQ